MHVKVDDFVPERFRALRIDCLANVVKAELRELGLGDLSNGDVIVRTAYAGLNYKDALATDPNRTVIPKYPRIGGGDFSGCVVASSNSKFAVGDEVLAYGNGIGVDVDGGFSEIVRIDGRKLMSIPSGMSLLDAAALGVAGFTAALSVHLLEEAGLKKNRCPVIVTGATGGVGSMAVDMLSGLGYEVTAMSGKADQGDVLLGVGAHHLLDGSTAPAVRRALESSVWSGAIDTVGGAYLEWLVKTMKPRAAIACVGNAAGNELHMNVLPLILRGIRLIGVNLTEYQEMANVLSRRLVGDLKPHRALKLVRAISLDDLTYWLTQIRDRKVTGRMVLSLGDA